MPILGRTRSVIAPMHRCETHRLHRHVSQVSLDPYRRESSRIIAIFKSMVTEGEVGEPQTSEESIAQRGLPLYLAIIEKASIDEAFLDLTLLTIKEILRRHPHLASVPSDAPQGMDTPLPPPPPISWAEAGNVFPVRGEVKNGESTIDHDGNDEEGTEGVGGWEDMALCIGAELMARLRGEVREKLGYTCSAVSWSWSMCLRAEVSSRPA